MQVKWTTKLSYQRPENGKQVTMRRHNKVRATDITYIPMARDFVYLIATADWFIGRVLACRVTISLDTDLCIQALEEALSRHDKPAIFNSDQVRISRVPPSPQPSYARRPPSAAPCARAPRPHAQPSILRPAASRSGMINRRPTT
jgi:transposase InsO family protein